MYKKVLSAILFGALTIASTSTFVSCKDYDDDIKSLKEQITANDTDNAALHTALTALETKVADLKTQLEAEDARLAALIQKLQTATEENKTAIQNEAKRAAAAEAALEARIATAEAAIAELKTLTADLKNNKVDKTEFNTKVQDIYAKIEAVETNLGSALTQIASLSQGLQNEETARKAAIADLQQQINALNAYTARVQTLEGSLGTVETGVQTLTTQLGQQASTLSSTSTDVESLKAQMAAVQTQVNNIITSGSATVINVMCNCNLKALVFIPDTYYYGIEATTIKALQPKWYTNMKELTTYIDKEDGAQYSAGVYKSTDKNRVEDVGIKGKPINTKEDAIVNYETAGLLVDHERYALSTGTISVVMSGEANYHMNPSNAKLDEETATVSIVDDEKSYVGTRASSAKVSAATANDGSKLWQTANGKLTVPLYVQNPDKIKEVHYTVTGTEAKPSNTSAVTIFATQVKFEGGEVEDTVITSDYAALILEEVKDLRLSHVKYNPAGTNNKDFIQTTEFNLHCGDCSLPAHRVNGVNIPAYSNKGLHLFGSVEEARYFVSQTQRIDAEATDPYKKGEGQDVVLYTEDINLNKLVETHYTNENGNHALFDAEDLARNFEYRFELTSFKFSTGSISENTNESAHAALYQGTDGDWYLHPQDPVAGGLYGRPYDPAKATEVVINRVPLVRVSLVYKKDNKVVDYGYLPIRIAGKPVKLEEQPAIAFDRYSSKESWALTKWNNCYLPNSKGFKLTTDWRKTEEDLMSHDSLKAPLDRINFEKIYSFEGSDFQDLPQYTFTKTATDKLNGVQQYKYVFTPCPTTGSKKAVGHITYDEGVSLDGMTTSVLEWEVGAAEIQSLAASGVTKVERAIKLVSADTYNYPDLYIIFETGAISVKNETVKGDAEITKHIIKQYWYTDASNDELTNNEDADEIHANTITPEENTAAKGAPYNAWKPTVLDDRFADVFYANFNGVNAPVDWIKLNPSTPFNKSNLVVDFVFDQSNDNRVFYGFIDNAKNDYKFTILTRYSGSLDKDLNGNSVIAWSETATGNLGAGKYLYAKSQQTGKVQIIAWIDKWDLNGDNTWALNELQQMKVSLNRNSNFARALLNYVSPKEMWQLKKGTLTTLPKSPSIDNILNATVALQVVSFKHIAGGTTYNCPLTLANNLFDVRFLRPLSIKEGNGPTIQDAAGNSTTGTNPAVDYGQKVVLDQLVTGYEDWRSLWKTTPNYEEYYAPDGQNKITVTVDALSPGDNLATNPNVYTDINGTRQRLNAVHGDIEFTIDSGDANILWYRNNSSTVNDFHVWIPVMVEYYWGEIYTEIEVTVKKTKNVKKQ